MPSTHIGFKVNKEPFNLKGNIIGIEALNGKTIEVTGYASYIVYIRKPDFIMFNVDSYRIID